MKKGDEAQEWQGEIWLLTIRTLYTTAGKDTVLKYT